VSPGGRHNLDSIANFVRNPLVQKQISTGYVHGKVIPFAGGYKIIHLKDYVNNTATVSGTIRIVGSEGDSRIMR
jgi:hypothetical protein